MLELGDQWVWDLWLVDTGAEFHMFFLKASRALQVEARRHGRAAIGHAVSTDLRHWTLLADALVHADEPAFDGRATWTGSTVQGPDGTWHLFYTGISRSDAVQRIGVATSPDLITWRQPAEALLEADPRWYETAADHTWDGVAWRDPWVFADPDGDGWHMLITARVNTSPADERGVIGHARSPDLRAWTVLAPLSQPGQGFGQLEVPQVVVVGGRAVLVFSCLSAELSDAHRARSGTTPNTGGIWTIAAQSVTGPFDASAAVGLSGPTRYSGRLIQDRDGRWVLMSFRYVGLTTGFVGLIGDPEPVGWTRNGLALVDGSALPSSS
jgi:beta-fructofuranosidase